MKTLVLVEHDNKTMKDATLAVVTAASQLGEVHALVLGSGCAAVGEQVAKVAGIATVHVADDPALEHQLAENAAPLIASLMETHDAFLAPATTTGKNIAPREGAGPVDLHDPAGDHLEGAAGPGRPSERLAVEGHRPVVGVRHDPG